MPIFSSGMPSFLFLHRFVIWYIIIPEERNRRFTWRKWAFDPKNMISVFWGSNPHFFQEGHSLFCFQVDLILHSRLFLKKWKGFKGEKTAIRPLKHIKNELKHLKYDLIFLGVPRSIYLRPYYIKGSYLEYQKLLDSRMLELNYLV